MSGLNTKMQINIKHKGLLDFNLEQTDGTRWEPCLLR